MPQYIEIHGNLYHIGDDGETIELAQIRDRSIFRLLYADETLQRSIIIWGNYKNYAHLPPEQADDRVRIDVARYSGEIEKCIDGYCERSIGIIKSSPNKDDSKNEPLIHNLMVQDMFMLLQQSGCVQLSAYKHAWIDIYGEQNFRPDIFEKAAESFRKRVASIGN